MLFENLDASKSHSNSLFFSRNPSTPQTSASEPALFSRSSFGPPLGPGVQHTGPIVPWAYLSHSWEQSEAGLQTPEEASSGAYLLTEYNYGASNLLCLVLNFPVSTCPVLGLPCAPLPGGQNPGLQGCQAGTLPAELHPNPLLLLEHFVILFSILVSLLGFFGFPGIEL